MTEKEQPLDTIGDRVRARREELKLSQVQLAKAVTKRGYPLSQQGVHKIEAGGSRRPKCMPELTFALKTTQEWLLKGTGSREPAQGKGFVPMPLAEVMTIGAVEAGVFREAIEWEQEEWRPAPVAALNNWRHLRQFGLEVRGVSMNLHYPPGSTVICVEWAQTGRIPTSGDHVVVLRRGQGDGFEATVKELLADDKGRWWLWPRSTSPSFQKPLEITQFAQSDDNDDVRIFALVIGAFVPRQFN